MNNRDITDEQLVAYVDGTLDEALKSEVEAMIESSDEMKEKVEAIQKTNLILSQVSKELQNEPLPQDIQNLIESHKQQEQKEADLGTVSHEDSKKTMPQWIKSTIETILPIRMPQATMLAASLLLGLYVGINILQEPVTLIIDANTEKGMYEVLPPTDITLRGEEIDYRFSSQVDDQVEFLDKQIIIQEELVENKIDQAPMYDMEIKEKGNQKSEESNNEFSEELNQLVTELEKTRNLLKKVESKVEYSVDKPSVENILERILKERRVESVITENNLQYQVKLLSSFEAVDGTYCDIGQIIDPEDGTLFFVGCPNNNGSFSIEFTDKKPQL